MPGKRPATVMDIVRQYLRREGYDGLVDPDAQCGCLVDDLRPCCPGEISGCRPGYKRVCRGCDLDGCDPGLGPANWHVSIHKSRSKSRAKLNGGGSR